MLIDSVTLKNFRQYKGVNTIKFSTDKNKNVTVVIGENTCGKTTLVQSFIWCLYGHVDFKDKKILNAEVRDELSDSTVGAIKEASVTVRLSHNNNNYLIERKELNRVGENKRITSEQKFKIFEVDLYGNTKPLETDDYDTIISDILPENLSDYFFFWGERIEKLAEKKELSGAVKQFLGLDTIDAAIRHLEKAVSRLTRDAGSGMNDVEIDKYNKKIQELEHKNSELDNEIDSCKQNIKHYKEQAEKYYAQLTTSENQLLQAKQNEYKDKSKILEIKKNDLAKARTIFTKHFNDSSNYVYFLANISEKKAVELLKRNPEPVIGWNFIDLNAINEIIKRKRCVCGNEFCIGDETYNYLIEQRKLVAPNVIGGVINSFVEESERRNIFNNQYYNLIHNDIKNINALNDEIVDLDYEVNQLKKYITGKADMKPIHHRYKEANKKVEDYNIRLGGLEASKNRNNSDIARCTNNIRILMDRNKKYNKQVRAIKYAQNVLEVFREDYTKNESTLKSKLETYVNKNFDEVYSGDRKIRIDDKYNAVAFNKVGDSWISSESSPGLETVKNFAFIAGLVQCAKEKIIGADGTETEANSNSYPLVLDAPFSQADEKHVPAISKLISNNAEQIILVVMKKDWNYAKDVLNDKVGKSYTLEKMTETHTFIREGE